MNKIKSLFQSRRFWVSAAGTILVAAEAFGLTGAEDRDTVFKMIMLIGAWVVGDSFRRTE